MSGTPSISSTTSLAASQQQQQQQTSHVDLLREQHRKLQQRYSALEAQLAASNPETLSSDSLLAALQRTVRSLCKSSLYRCGERAVSDIHVDNSISILNLANDVKEEGLLKYATGFIVSHWQQYERRDFDAVAADLLFRVVKEKTAFALHTAVKLNREDVIFLFLLEHDADLPAVIDQLDDDDETALQIALESEQEKIADTLVQHGAGLNVKNSSGASLLHQSVQKGKLFAAGFLIERGADVTAVDAAGQTPLHIAGATNLANAATALLDANADPNTQDGEGNTPLHCAVKSQSTDTARTLLSCDRIHPDERNAEGHSALWLALSLDSHALAADLVRRGCSVDVTAANGDSMLHDAIRCNKTDAALFLLDHNCAVDVVDEQQRTPLHLAAAAGDDAVVAKLLERGAPANAQDTDMSTPLMAAVTNNKLPVVARLLQTPRIDLETKNTEGRTALGLCVKDDVMDEICYLLLQKGANIDTQLPNGDGLLHDAIRHGRVAAAAFLIDNGADLEAASADNETPLTLCIRHSQPAIATKLCECGANVNRSVEGKATPLLQALRAREEEIASILVRHECDVDITDAETGLTALHKAIADKDEFAALFLMRHGADVNASNNADMETPLHIACSVGIEVMPLITELLRNRADINAQDRHLQTPLHRCLYKSHTDVAANLLVHPKLRPAIRDDEDRTLFGVALHMRQYDICTQLLQINEDAIEERDHNGMTYLHAALAAGAAEDVDVLIKLGVDVNARIDDPSQRIALAIAVERGLEAEAVKLLKAGARHDIPDAMSGWTVAHMAASLNCGLVLDQLIKHGADMNATDFQGDGVLHAAMRAGHEAVVQQLMAEDVDLDPTRTNNAGETALHVLGQFPKQNATRLLELAYTQMKRVLNATDGQGNTALLLAYKNRSMPGAGRLCIALVVNGAQLNIANHQRETCFSVTGKDRRFLFKLLGDLPWEQPWAEGEYCQECNVKFGTRTRRHHCRHCGRVLCDKCSQKKTPIVKFKLDKPVRVCNVCFDLLSGLTS
ncbi:hypothetical protein PTSG_11174 [Salpingoeca rosetta]|uniref:FYVE-type domain-containing protein n=1 Tax=Salpingoeca rosetta (strain ATCC 50818 / BSB-021) TaxID=946362 RepID=F2USM7_SALR5|nr:uncharacterized protein PTSG_11174 [Salpingoeca rosetta]EGD81136.1 hypothetical protein PTSG_11174 [Salpingoeca rosetta]|eukprot:XP_004987821.1 hypothetical protein PTSG_11174 [Salpingoeca rosetta]